MGYVEESLGRNETIVYKAHFHRLYYAAAWVSLIFFGALIPVALGFTSGADTWALVLTGVASCALVLHWMIPVWTTEIAVTTHRLVIKRGWLSRSTNELQLKSVEQVVFHQGVLGRVFDFGKIEVHGTGDDDIKLPNIACPPISSKRLRTRPLPSGHSRQSSPEFRERGCDITRRLRGVASVGRDRTKVTAPASLYLTFHKRRSSGRGPRSCCPSACQPECEGLVRCRHPEKAHRGI